MPLPSLEDLLDLGIKLISPVLAGGFFATESPEKSTLSLWVNSNMFANSSQIHASNIYIFFMKLVTEYEIDLWFALLIIR